MQNFFQTPRATLLLCSFLGFSTNALKSSAQTPTPTHPTTNRNTSTNADPTKAPPVSYRLNANDTVTIQVFQEDELTITARIGKDGAITFPLVGSVVIGGRSVPEATNIISRALREYLLHPQVSMRIVEYSKKRFTVLGQVNRPGSFDLPDENSLTLLEGIGLAGGYNRIANPSKIMIKRHSAEGETIFRIDAKQMAKGTKTPSFQILPGDTVIVEESLF